MRPTPDPYARTEDRDGMRITWQQPIPMDDGIVLRADVFRPIPDGAYPVILSYGVYAKGLAFQEGYPKLFDPQGKEITFMGSTDPNTPIANGWLRASHRRLDPARSLPYRPYHPHDRVEPLTPGEVYECDVEIVTSCIVVPAGWRLALTVRGKDYEYTGELSEFARQFHYATRGTGGMTHDDPDHRPRDVFGGTVTLHAGGGRDAYLLLPIIPPKRGG
jgi:predicted acyl esterase